MSTTRQIVALAAVLETLAVRKEAQSRALRAAETAYTEARDALGRAVQTLTGFWAMPTPDWGEDPTTWLIARLESVESDRCAEMDRLRAETIRLETRAQEMHTLVALLQPGDGK